MSIRVAPDHLPGITMANAATPSGSDLQIENARAGTAGRLRDPRAATNQSRLGCVELADRGGGRRLGPGEGEHGCIELLETFLDLGHVRGVHRAGELLVRG